MTWASRFPHRTNAFLESTARRYDGQLAWIRWAWFDDWGGGTASIYPFFLFCWGLPPTVRIPETKNGALAAACNDIQALGHKVLHDTGGMGDGVALLGDTPAHPVVFFFFNLFLFLIFLFRLLVGMIPGILYLVPPFLFLILDPHLCLGQESGRKERSVSGYSSIPGVHGRTVWDGVMDFHSIWFSFHFFFLLSAL